jgi:hypothetical protein
MIGQEALKLCAAATFFVLFFVQRFGQFYIVALEITFNGRIERQH